jgi:hypothetical protein
MALTQPEPHQLARIAVVVEIGMWVALGGTAMLWWVPERMGEKNTIPWQQAAFFYVGLWIWVLNHWPRLGTKRFFLENRFIYFKLVLLIFIGVGFAYGLLTAA